MPDEAHSGIRVTSTSSRTADVTPIVLRETSTTRLIFKPVLIDNPNDNSASIDGTFVYQRRSRNSVWTDHSDLSLSQLRAEEWVKIELKAAELLKFFSGLSNYYRFVEDRGIPFGSSEFIPAPKSQAIRSLLEDEEALQTAFGDEELSSALLSGLIRWMISRESAVLAARLDGVTVEELQQFDAILGLARLQRFLRELDENATIGEERIWQDSLSRNGWAIAQVFTIPVMLLQSQVYVGGKHFSNLGGNTADFLYENNVTGNVVLVEIKTPLTPLLGSRYRNNVYGVSDEVSGGMAQLLYDRASLSENFDNLATEDMQSSRALAARGLLIVGDTSISLRNHEQKRCFEQWRNNQREIEIVTFDELRAKVRMMVELFENSWLQNDQ